MLAETAAAPTRREAAPSQLQQLWRVRPQSRDAHPYRFDRTEAARPRFEASSPVLNWSQTRFHQQRFARNRSQRGDIPARADRGTPDPDRTRNIPERLAARTAPAFLSCPCVASFEMSFRSLRPALCLQPKSCRRVVGADRHPVLQTHPAPQIAWDYLAHSKRASCQRHTLEA